MSETRTRPERIDLLGVDDPRDVLHRSVACLAEGGVLAFPSETCYVLIAGAMRISAIERLRAASTGSLAMMLRGASEIQDWVPQISQTALKIANRGWPGPITLHHEGDMTGGLIAFLPPAVRSYVAPDRNIQLRVPSHNGLREIRDLYSGPLAICDAPAKFGERAWVVSDLPDEIDLEMIVDDGASRLGGRNTVVAVNQEHWELTDRGVVSDRDVLKMTATQILFVCTGNTCRSPMAEALCRLSLSWRIGCAPHELEQRGYVISSAGLAVNEGARAASEAVAAIQARGVSLHDHSSRQLSPKMIASADFIIAMTRDQLDAILDQHPQAEDRTRLLHPRGGDVADPIGCDRSTYVRTAEAIESYLSALIDEICPKA